MDKTIRVPEAVYKRIVRIAKNEKRNIRLTIEHAFDVYEGLRKRDQ